MIELRRAAIANAAARHGTLRRKRGGPRAAFTLLEVLIVILLLVILAAVVWPDFSANRSAEQLAESGRRFKTLIAMCRAEAMNLARTHRIEFRADGSLQILRQLDPVYAPAVYLPIPDAWASLEILGEDVWVESLTPLSFGPDALEIEDDELVTNTEFLDEQEEAARILIGDLEADWPLEIDSNGLSPTVRWVLRDRRGRGLQMTLDGRLGRVTIEEVEAKPAEDVQRPEALEAEEEPYAGMSEAEVLEEFLP